MSNNILYNCIIGGIIILQFFVICHYADKCENLQKKVKTLSTLLSVKNAKIKENN